MSKTSYYTQEGLNKLKEELNYLKDIERPKASQAIAEARDKGDLSENAEYDAAKEAQGMLEMRIAKMEERLAELRSEGVYDYPVQIEGLNDQYATALAEGYTSRAASILGKMERLSPFANEFNKITTKLEDAYEQEAVLKKRYDLNKLDSESQIPAAFVVDRAAVADKKARPIRWLITVMGAISVALAALVFFLFRDAVN